MKKNEIFTQSQNASPQHPDLQREKGNFTAEKLHQVNQQWHKQTPGHKASALEEPSITSGAPAKMHTPKRIMRKHQNPNQGTFFKVTDLEILLSTKVLKARG